MQENIVLEKRHWAYQKRKTAKIPIFGEKIPQNSPKTPTHIFSKFQIPHKCK